MKQNRVYLYGFDRLHRVKDTVYLWGQDISIGNIIEAANAMYDEGNICKVYAIDNFSGLREDFMASVKTVDFTVHIEFEDEISRGGILIPYKK